MIISIAVCDDNAEYVARLLGGDGLAKYDNLKLSVYTDPAKLVSALNETGVDILLFNPDITSERLPLSKVKLPVLLYSEEQTNASRYLKDNVDHVEKYQRISSIYRKIIDLFSEKAGYVPDGGSGAPAKIISVYSPVGGSGKTLSAFAVALFYARAGKKTLLLSAEEISSLPAVFSEGSGSGSNIDLINAAGKEDTSLSLKLQGIVRNGPDGLFYVDGFEKVVDYSAVSKDEWKKLLDGLVKCGLYDIIIFDMGSAVDDTARTLFENSEIIIVINRPGTTASEKIRRFSMQSIFMKDREKFVELRNFAENNSVYDESLGLRQVGAIHNYGNLDVKSIVNNALLNHEMILDGV